MNNEKMTFAGLKELEDVLHRDLTDTECAIGYSKNLAALLDYIELNEDELESFNDLYDLMIAYFTMNRIDFEKYRNSRAWREDLDELLTEFVEGSHLFDEKTNGFDMDEKCGDPVDNEPDHEMTAEQICEYLKNNLKDEDNYWIKTYIDLDPAMPELTNKVLEMCEDDIPHCFEDELPNLLNLIKEVIIKKTVNRLIKTGESEELSEPLLTHVCEFIDRNVVNYSMRVVNNKIRVKKF